MSSSLQKYSLESNIRFFYFRYRGDIAKIVENLKKLPGYQDANIDPIYVEKVIKKFKRQRKNDWNLNTCYTFMEYLHMGAQERLARYQEWLDKLENASEIRVSSCHRAPVGQRETEEGLEYVCLQPGCGKPCETMLLQEPGIYDLRLKILEEMRKDEELLLKAIKDLGFSANPPEEVKRITNYNLITHVESPSHSKKVNAKEVEIIEDTKDFTPIMREKLIKDIEKKLESEDE